MDALIRRYFLSTVLVLLFLPALDAQQSAGWAIEPTFHYGKLFKHTPKLLFEVTEPSYALELAFKKQTMGTKSWQQLQGYPMLGFSLMAYRMGPPDTLGYAFSVAPNLSISILRRSKWDLHFLFGYGLAYLTKTFDLSSNPINNAIGSHLNVTVQLRLEANIKLNDKWHIHTGGSFTHYSNGASQLPNYGLNIPAGMLGLRYIPKAWSTDIFTKSTTEQRKVDRHFGLDWYMGMGFKERGGIGGPRSPVYLTSLAGVYATNKINRLLLGMEYEYNQGVYLFGRHVGEFETEQEGRRKSMRWMLFLGDEMIFGDFSLSMQMGVYLQNVYLGIFPLYNRFTVRYYFPPVGHPAGQFYAAFQLKSHLVIAEYFSLIGGIRF